MFCFSKQQERDQTRKLRCFTRLIGFARVVFRSFDKNKRGRKTRSRNRVRNKNKRREKNRENESRARALNDVQTIYTCQKGCESSNEMNEKGK